MTDDRYLKRLLKEQQAKIDQLGKQTNRLASSNGLYANTSFPAGGTVATGSLAFRTDLGWLCYYNGFNWITVHEYLGQGLGSAAVTTDTVLFVKRSDYRSYVRKIALHTLVGTTNDGANYWNVYVRGIDPPFAHVDNVFLKTTSADTVGVWTEITTAPNISATPVYDAWFDCYAVRVGSPGTLTFYITVYYQLLIA